MSQVYGVTANDVQQEYFPGNPLPATGKFSVESITRLVTGAAASVNAVVSSHGIDPDEINAIDHASSHAYLADTVRLGAAIRVARIGMLGIEAEVVKSWSSEFEKRLGQLRDDPGTWLGQVLPSGGGDVASFVTDPEVCINAPVFAVDDEN